MINRVVFFGIVVARFNLVLIGLVFEALRMDFADSAVFIAISRMMLPVSLAPPMLLGGELAL